MINLTGLSKAYDGNQVLNGIDLEVKKGESRRSRVDPYVQGTRRCPAGRAERMIQMRSVWERLRFKRRQGGDTRRLDQPID